ncbi:hypothetical protein PpBr36_01396 [Pyricularia pennisetigena]|uniref:hypothetical protein n=1 Tax=Pyricularia pennisetigena TaxID=1578925 RepID=UPI0011545316|nr:hypothetical protein PpBr36_01396 [Pyricularia pennisetigena]TLS28037.1 hypothetical protein PpBr36_01396 [Pyricularia pennisetigena]
MPNTPRVLLVLAALAPLAWGSPSSGNLGARQLETQEMPRPTFGPVPWGEQLGRDDFPCTKPGRIAFTFEDGPSPYTASIVNTLRRYSIKAAFFMTGDFQGEGLSQPRHQGLARSMYGQGHLLGSHSYSHGDLRSFTEDEVRADLLEMEATFVEALGVVPTYFRAPFTECDVGDCLVDIRPLRYHIVDYNVDSFDNDEFADPADLVAFFRETLAGADLAVASYIVRFHDSEEATADGLLEDFILVAADRGFEFVTVGECLGDDPGNFYRNSQTGNALGSGEELPASPIPSSAEPTAAPASTSFSSSSVEPGSSASETAGAPEVTGNPGTMISDTQTSTAAGQEATVTPETLTRETLSVASTTVDTAGSEDSTITATQTSAQTETDTRDGSAATSTPTVTGTSDLVITSDGTTTITQTSLSGTVTLTSSEQTTEDVSQTALGSSVDATRGLVTTLLVSQTTGVATSEESPASQSLIATSTASETTSIGSGMPASSVVDGQVTSEALSDPGIITSTGTGTGTGTGFRTSTASVTDSWLPSETVSDSDTPSATISTTVSTTCTTATCVSTTIMSSDETAKSATSTDGESESGPTATLHPGTGTGGIETLDRTTQDAQTTSRNVQGSSPTSASDTTSLPAATRVESPGDDATQANTPAAPSSPTCGPETTPSSAAAHPPNHVHYASGTTVTHSAGATRCPRTTGDAAPQPATMWAGGAPASDDGKHAVYAAGMPLVGARPAAAGVAGLGVGGLSSGAGAGGGGGSTVAPTRVLDAGGFALGGSGRVAVAVAALAWMVV